MSSCRCSTTQVLQGHAPGCGARALAPWQEAKLAAIAACRCPGKALGGHVRTCKLREAEAYA